MKLKKFRRRWRKLLNEAGAEEVVTEVKKPTQYLLGGLLAFALILIVGFLVIPYALHPNKKADKKNADQTLSYTLKNDTSKDWKGVEVTIKGDLNIVGSNPKTVWTVVKNDEGVFTTFMFGEVKAHQSRDFSVVAHSDLPDEEDTVATFKDSAGRTVHLPVKKKVFFQ